MFYGQNNEGKNDAPFNMAMMFYFRLNELLQQKDNALINGDVIGYYSSLKAIFNNIYFQIKNEDKTKELQDNLDTCFKLINIVPVGDKKAYFQARELNYSDAMILLDKIDLNLMLLMDKKKMIFPRIETHQGIENVRKKLGL